MTGDVMEKIEFEVTTTEPGVRNCLLLRFSNFHDFHVIRKGDKLDRKLHVHDGDRFKVTIQKVKA